MNINDSIAATPSRLAHKAQRGFTLIELMIVIAIIGILAAIAIPAYQNYLIRSQVTEGLSLADGYKTAVSEFYAQYGAFPSAITAAGAAPAAGTAALPHTQITSLLVSPPGDISRTPPLILEFDARP